MRYVITGAALAALSVGCGGHSTSVDDRVRQLDINASQMTPAERAAIRCATTR